MTICFKNQSELCIDIYIDKSHIALPCNESYTYNGIFECTPIEIKFSISDSKINTVSDSNYCLYISTIILCDFANISNITLTIQQKANKFQNYTEYQYLTINSSDLNIYNINHTVDDLETLQPYVQASRKNKLLYLLKNSLIDMLLEGFILSILIAWIFSWKVALASLFTIFMIAFVVNTIKLKTSKSKHRIFNWDKDTELPDDIEYFVNNIEKYCS